MRPAACLLLWSTAIAVHLATPGAWAQVSAPPPPEPPPTREALPPFEPLPTREAPPPFEPLGVQPLRILQQVEPGRRGPFTVTPSVTVTEEYNDNVLLDNRNRRWDLITNVTPGISLVLERQRYRLSAAYNFTAEYFARDSNRDEAFAAQSFLLDGLYRLDPRVTATLTDTFVLSRDTNLVSTQGVATGRNRSWSNTVSPGLTWQVEPRTTLRLTGSYTAQRFERTDLNDSDVYRGGPGIERVFTPRLTGTLDYEYAFFDVEREEDVTAHTLRTGGRYRLTPTLTASLSAGATYQSDGRSRVTPAANAEVTQRSAWGQMSVFYERSVGTAGGLGATADNQAVGALVRATSLARGLALEVAPRYTTTKSRAGGVDVRTTSVALRGVYQLSRWLALVASYTFFQQRPESSAAGAPPAAEVDQNLISFSLRLGYPITLY